MSLLSLTISAQTLFTPITPCRVLDTRLTGGIVAAGETRVLKPTGCDLPNNVVAYVLNVTVIPSTFLAFLTVWPTGKPQPVASTLNALQGGVVANAAIVGAGTNSSINLFASHETHIVVDVNGYFTNASLQGEWLQQKSQDQWCFKDKVPKYNIKAWIYHSAGSQQMFSATQVDGCINLPTDASVNRAYVTATYMI